MDGDQVASQAQDPSRIGALLRVWILPAFGNSRLDRIDLIAVESWIADMKRAGLSPSRIRQAHQALSAILKAAVKNRYLALNLAAGASLPRTTRLTAAQVYDLAGAMPEPYGTLVYVLGYGGLRWGEAAALHRRRIDVLRARIEIAESLAEVSGEQIFGPTKSYRTRLITLPRYLRDMLNTHLTEQVRPDPDALVFTSTGRTYKTKTINAGTPLRNSNFTRRSGDPPWRQRASPPT